MNGKRKRARAAGALVLTTLAAGCAGDGAGGAAAAGTPVVRDSAGVRIVENGEAPAGGWRVVAEPLFTVGWEPDAPPFTWIQSGRILPDGGALVGDFDAGAIYRIGPDGSVLGTWGRKGEGPGEFQGLDALVLRGDSILVSDGRLRRVTLLSADGEVVATRPLAGSFLHRVSAALDDGRLLLVPGEGYSGAAATRPEWVFETQPILALDPETGAAETLAELPHLRRWYGVPGGSPGPIHVKGRAGGYDEGFAWARSDEREIRWYDGSGRLVQVARWREEPVPLTPAWRQQRIRTLEEALRSIGRDEAGVSAQVTQLEEGLDLYEGPLPYWDSFHVDRLGNVWASDYPILPQPPGRWRVFTRDGAFTGWVDLPDVISVLDITDDRVLGVRLGELRVPAVVLLELVKP